MDSRETSRGYGLKTFLSGRITNLREGFSTKLSDFQTWTQRYSLKPGLSLGAVGL
jgi:hypothetical protein